MPEAAEAPKNLTKKQSLALAVGAYESVRTHIEGVIASLPTNVDPADDNLSAVRADFAFILNRLEQGQTGLDTLNPA